MHDKGHESKHHKATEAHPTNEATAERREYICDGPAQSHIQLSMHYTAPPMGPAPRATVTGATSKHAINTRSHDETTRIQLTTGIKRHKTTQSHLTSSN